MNSIPISPGLHALLNAAASESALISSPLPAASNAATRSSPLLTSISTSSHFLSALHLRSPPSSAPQSSGHTVTGMSILKMPPAVSAQSPTAASASTASSPSPTSHPESPEQEGDTDSSLPFASPARHSPDSPLSSLASASSTHSSTPSAQLQSAFFSSPTTAPTSSSTALHTPHINHSPLTSLLQPHSSTLQVRRNSTGGSGITKLLSSFKRTTKATTTLTTAASSSLFKKKLTAASPLTASSSAASDSAGGSSCHQCKSRRNYGDLSYCSSSLNKKNKNAVCRKKYCDHCLPEHDTRVLTDAGFLFLKDIEERIAAGESVLYACYDTSTQSMVYTTGRLVLAAPPMRWVDFTHAGTRHLWDATSGDYGATVPANGVQPNYLTLRTTPEHDMYVQLCTGHEKDDHQQYEPRVVEGAPIPPHKQPARELAPGYQCDCVTAGHTCTHGYSHYRMYTGAASGRNTPADVISLTDCDERSPVAALGLQSKDELDAFLELFGYWLGHGSMSHDTCASLTSANAVCFTARQACDRAYLRNLLAPLQLACGQHVISNESDSRLEVRIIEPRWFRFFDTEFGVRCDRRLVPLKQGMHYTQRRLSAFSLVSASATEPVSLAGSTRARSVSNSTSFSSSASVIGGLVTDYRSDDDMSPLCTDQGEDDLVESVKWLPNWTLFRLDAQQLRLVLEGLRHADGGGAMQGERQICTSNVDLRDQLVHACVHAGYSAYFKLKLAAGEVRGYIAVPDDDTIHTEEEMEAALRFDSTRQFKPVHFRCDSWWVCYSEVVSEVLSAQDVRFDGRVCRVRRRRGQAIQQELDAAIDTHPGDLYDQVRDGRAWCVSVDHSDQLIFVQRAHCNVSGVVTKVGRTMIVGNCLKKFYREAPITADGQVWKCPSCRKICCCAACRRREMRGGGGPTAANGINGHGAVGDATNGDMEGANVGMDTPPSTALSPVHSSSRHEQQQQQQDVEMSPVDQSPPQSAFQSLLLSPHTPSLQPLPASALSSREKERDSREGKDELLPIRDIHRTLLTVANSPALTALSAAASTLNGGSYNIKKEKASGLLDGGSMGGGAGAGRYAGLMTASLSRGLGVSGLNGHSLLNGHKNGRRRGGYPDLNGHESSTSSPSSSDGSDDDTVDGEGASSVVGDKDDESRSSQLQRGTDSFALFYSIGLMSAVQEGVREVMKRSEVSNAQKLKEIESIFFQVAEKVGAEEVPLQP